MIGGSVAVFDLDQGVHAAVAAALDAPCSEVNAQCRARRDSRHTTIQHRTARLQMNSNRIASDVTLRDGRTVRIRAIDPSDEAELLRAFDRLSPAARYMRFMRFVNDPNLERFRRLLASFPEAGTAVVATMPAADGIDIVGAAFFVFGSDASTCEFAINVAAEFGGAGLGGTLMRALIDAARQRGLRTMEGFVLADNKSMLGLARRLGFTVARYPTSWWHPHSPP